MEKGDSLLTVVALWSKFYKNYSSRGSRRSTKRNNNIKDIFWLSTSCIRSESSAAFLVALKETVVTAE